MKLGGRQQPFFWFACCGGGLHHIQCSRVSLCFCSCRLEMWAQVGSASLSSLTNVSASVESDVEQSVSGCQAESFYLSVGLGK
jgi:hypothetical protein